MTPNRVEGLPRSTRVCQSGYGTTSKGWRETAFEAREQQLESTVGGDLHSEEEEDEGLDCCECSLSGGQRLRCEGEGSGLRAGDPAGTTTAARDWRPEHAMTRWLTDQLSSATIRTPPLDRLLAIAVSSVHQDGAGFCDCSHTVKQFAKCFGSNAIRRKTALLAAAVVWPSLALGTTAKAPQSVKKNCGAGVMLKVSAGKAAQGGLLLTEVTGVKQSEQVVAEWDGRSVPLWRESQGTGALHGLIGIDLEKEPGSYEWKVSWTGTDGTLVACIVPIKVQAGKFATERLTVERQYVEPDPEQQKRVEEDQKKMRAIYDTVTPETLWKGKFRLPLKDLPTGKNFGRRRVLNGEARSPHTGVDFPAATGTPVYASQSGKVVLAENLYYSGNTVVIDHGFGIYTLYAHLSEITVHAGDEVEASTEIGKVGATGRVTGPHLHWGLTVGHARVNGLQIVEKRP